MPSVLFMINLHISIFQVLYSWVTMTSLLVLSVMVYVTQGAPYCSTNQVVNYYSQGQSYKIKCSCMQHCRNCQDTYLNYDGHLCYSSCAHESLPQAVDLYPMCTYGMQHTRRKRKTDAALLSILSRSQSKRQTKTSR